MILNLLLVFVFAFLVCELLQKSFELSDRMDYIVERVSNVASFMILALLFAIMLAGCSQQPVKDTVVPAAAIEVKVPVPVCSNDLLMTLAPKQRPHLPISDLTVDDLNDFDKVAKAYQSSIALLAEYATSLERNQQQAAAQCKVVNDAANALNTKSPVLPVQPK